MNRKIDFFIVGAQKAGTTSLDRYLDEHPEIFLPKMKEIEYFITDSYYNQGIRYLNPFYQDIANQKIIGMSAVQLIFLDYVPKRIHDYNPDAKIIMMFRNPIDRAYSAFWYAKRMGREPLVSFEKALEREENKKIHGFYPSLDLTYLKHGYYAEQLKYFLKYFPKDKIYILLLDDIKKDKNFIYPLLAWLGVNPEKGNLNTEKVHNESAMPKYIWLSRMIKSPDSTLKKIYRYIMPFKFRTFVQRHITDQLIENTLVPFKYPPMNKKTRGKLYEHFKTHNERLSKMLGKDLSSWR